MNFSKHMWLVLIIMVCSALALAASQKPHQTTQPQPKQKTPQDQFQRSWKVYNAQTAATAGWQRGEEIYYYKCWMCHNKYAKTGPFLQNLYQRSQLVSGEPVNDKTVIEKIKNGGEHMPAYRHTLSDTDIEDLLVYLQEKCCFDANEPPPNPDYRYQTK